MELRIKETNEVKDLSIRTKDGIEWTRDLLGNYDALDYNQDTEEYEMIQDDYEWWAEYIRNHEYDEQEITDLAEKLGYKEDEIRERINDHLGCELGDEHAVIQRVLSDIRKDTFAEMVRDWQSDNAPEYDDLKIESPEFDEETGALVAYAKDASHSYTLTADSNGNIIINYAGTR